MINLTENEIVAMKSCLNYDDKESQLKDNFSPSGLQEFKNILGWNKHQVAGLISSLEQKGMGELDEEDDIFFLSDEGIEAIFQKI